MDMWEASASFVTRVPPLCVIMEAPASLRVSTRTSAAAHLDGQVTHSSILTVQGWFITLTIVGLSGGKMINWVKKKITPKTIVSMSF